MNAQLALETSYLSQSKSKFHILKRGIEMMVGNAWDESVTPPVQIVVNIDKVKELLQYVIYILQEMLIPEQLQAIADNEQDSTLFLTLYQIIAEAIRLRIQDKAFKDALHTFNLPQQFVKTIFECYTGYYVVLTSAARAERISQPTLDSFEWRIDVIISNTQLNKAFIPIILFQLTTSNGDIKTFECDIPTFHRLRYSVAKMCAIMQEIDAHPTLQRLVD